MGLLERAQFVEQKQVKFQETPSGLLKRASLIHTLMEKKEEQFPKEVPGKKKAYRVSSEGSAESIDPELVTRIVLKDLAALPQSFEAPAQLFHILKNRLKIRKGALLLPDETDGILAPWSLTGYDRTTSFRLRIPSSQIYDVFHRSRSSVMVLEKNSLSNYGFRFSSREQGLMETLLVHCIFYQDRLLGALIISDSPVLFWDPSLIRLFFTVIDELTAPLLYAFRGERQEKIRPTLLTEAELFREYLTEKKAPQLYLLRLETKPLLQLFTQANPDIDPFRTLRDIGSFLSNMLDGAPVYILPEQNKLFFSMESVGFDGELLVHQIETAFKQFFPELSSLTEINIQWKLIQPQEIDAIDFNTFTA
jgi:hypothetical protein